VLWEPLGPMRPRVSSPEHERPSGVGTDYCAVREHAGRWDSLPDGVSWVWKRRIAEAPTIVVS
jgi:hypothetical protein